ncbi:MAG: hypothetical protein GC201_11625 [Alphaproteobacteria bacterium]|nr:hypothetical protein [Alphaproteobacteria bacterium]
MAEMMDEDLQQIAREVCRAAYREMKARGISEVATAGAFLQYSASGLAQLGMHREDIHDIVDGVIDRTIELSPISVPAGRA